MSCIIIQIDSYVQIWLYSPGEIKIFPRIEEVQDGIKMCLKHDHKCRTIGEKVDAPGGWRGGAL